MDNPRGSRKRSVGFQRGFFNVFRKWIANFSSLVNFFEFSEKEMREIYNFYARERARPTTTTKCGDPFSHTNPHYKIWQISQIFTVAICMAKILRCSRNDGEMHHNDGEMHHKTGEMTPHNGEMHI